MESQSRVEARGVVRCTVLVRTQRHNAPNCLLLHVDSLKAAEEEPDMLDDDEDGTATLSHRDAKSVNSRPESVAADLTPSETTAREPTNIDASSENNHELRQSAEEEIAELGPVEAPSLQIRATTTSSNACSERLSDQCFPTVDTENQSNSSSTASDEDESFHKAAFNNRPSPPQQHPPSTTPVVRSAALLERIQNERKRSQARVEIIKRLRNLRARSANTKLTHISTESSSDAVSLGFGESIISVESQDMSESNSSISTETRVAPPGTVLVDTSASRYLEVARIERDRANTFLVELAKAKAEILRLKHEEEAFKNYHAKLLRQEERNRLTHSSAPHESETATLTSWTNRFWNKRHHCQDDGSQQTYRDQSFIQRSQDTEDSREVDAIDDRQEHQKWTHHHSSNRRNVGNRTIEENQELLQQMMQIMSSLHERTDLSVQLDLKPCVHGWSLNSATVKRPDEGGGVAADGK